MTIDSANSSGEKSHPETVRRAYLRHESNVRSLGQLCYLVAFFGSLGTLEFVLYIVGVLPFPPELNQVADPSLIRVLFWVMLAAFALITVVHIILGYGLTHLQPWARWTVVVVTVLNLVSGSLLSLVACLSRPVGGLISLIVGGAINGLILYPLLSTGSRMVFSEFYKDVIRRTPTIKSRMHWLLKLLIALILASVLGFLGFLAAIYFRVIDW